jgi:hypothetical protein
MGLAIVRLRKERKISLSESVYFMALLIDNVIGEALTSDPVLLGLRQRERSVLEDVGFSRVVEAGLGKGPTKYLAFQMHSFPGPQPAREVWSAARTAIAASQSSELIRIPAYKDLAGGSGDRSQTLASVWPLLRPAQSFVAAHVAPGQLARRRGTTGSPKWVPTTACSRSTELASSATTGQSTSEGFRWGACRKFSLLIN